MIVPWTADGFRAMAIALRTLDERKGVSSHTFLPEDRCVRLLFKNLGRQMPEDVIQEELEALFFSVQGVFHLCSGHQYQNTSKACHLTPNLVVSVAQGCKVLKVHSLTCVACKSWWRCTSPLRALFSASAASALATCTSTADMHSGMLLVVRPFWGVLYPSAAA